MYSPENHQTSPEIAEIVPRGHSLVFAGCNLLSTLTIFDINLYYTPEV